MERPNPCCSLSALGAGAGDAWGRQGLEVQIHQVIFAAVTVLLSLEGHHHQGMLLLHPRYAHCHDVHFHETLAEIRVGQTRQVLQGRIEGG